MYRLIFTESVSEAHQEQIMKIFSEYYDKIRREIFLSTEEVEIFFHYSNNGILDCEANMLQRFLFFHLSKNFTDDDFLILLAHELFHLAHFDFFGETEENIDTIVDEGLAIFVEKRIRDRFELNGKIQSDTWLKVMSEPKNEKMLKLAFENDDIFDSEWWTLHFNKDLKDSRFADNTIYQVGFWLVGRIFEGALSFKEMFFADKDFWHEKVKEIVESE